MGSPFFMDNFCTNLGVMHYFCLVGLEACSD